MKSILLAAAAMGLAISAAQAECNYHKSVSAEQIDRTTVASVALPQSQPVVTDEDAAVPAEEDAK